MLMSNLPGSLPSLGPSSSQPQDKQLRLPAFSIPSLGDEEAPLDPPVGRLVEKASFSSSSNHERPKRKCPIEYIGDDDDSDVLFLGSQKLIHHANPIPSAQSLRSSKRTKPSSSRTIVDLTLDASPVHTQSSKLSKQVPPSLSHVKLSTTKSTISAPSLPAISLAASKCGICLDMVTDAAATHCGHVFCYECIKLAQKATKKCPLCRKSVSNRQYHRLYIS